MKTPKYTPGPWTWDKDRDTVLSNHPDWQHSMICKIATGEDRKQEDANARLIALAPEMAEALRQALPVIDAHRRISGGEGDLAAATIRALLSRLDS